MRPRQPQVRWGWRRAKVLFCSCFPKDVSQAVMVIKWLTVSSSVYEVTRSNITNVLYPTPRWGQIDGDKINTIVPPSLLPRTANWPTWSVSWEDGVLIIMTGNDTRMIHVPVHHHYHPIHCTHTYTHLVIHCNSPLNPFPSRPTAVHWPSQHNWQTICNHEDLQTIISLDNCLWISHLSCHVFNVKSAEWALEPNTYIYLFNEGKLWLLLLIVSKMNCGRWWWWQSGHCSCSQLQASLMEEMCCGRWQWLYPTVSTASVEQWPRAWERMLDVVANRFLFSVLIWDTVNCCRQ